MTLTSARWASFVLVVDPELRGLEVGSDGLVNGTVVNGSGVMIKDVELLVSHAWSWSDERHPGEDNPGRAGSTSA